jgi:hypothetical protein
LAAIDQLFVAAFHFERRLNVITTGSAENRNGSRAAPELGHIGSLRDEFSRYLAANRDGALPREELEKLGLHYLAEAEREEMGE